MASENGRTSLTIVDVGAMLGGSVLLAVLAYAYSMAGRAETPDELARRIVTRTLGYDPGEPPVPIDLDAYGR